MCFDLNESIATQGRFPVQKLTSFEPSDSSLARKSVVAISGSYNLKIRSFVGVSQSLVSAILSTWIPLIALELKPLIHWPTREEAQQYKNVVAIIDCTEVPIQRPSLALANGQIYSFYKGRPTCKLFVACTYVGTVSFVSSAAAGAMSDKRLVKESGIL